MKSHRPEISYSRKISARKCITTKILCRKVRIHENCLHESAYPRKSTSLKFPRAGCVWLNCWIPFGCRGRFPALGNFCTADRAYIYRWQMKVWRLCEILIRQLYRVNTRKRNLLHIWLTFYARTRVSKSRRKQTLCKHNRTPKALSYIEL